MASDEIPAASLATISGGNVAITPIDTSDPNTIALDRFRCEGGQPLFHRHPVRGNIGRYAGEPRKQRDLGIDAPGIGQHRDRQGADLLKLLAPGQTGGPGPGKTSPTIRANWQLRQRYEWRRWRTGRTGAVANFSTISDGIWELADNGTPFTATSLPTFYAVAGKNGTTATPGDMTGGKGLAVGAPGRFTPSAPIPPLTTSTC